MRRTIVFIVLTSAAALQADILHLRDGSRHYGELVSRTETATTFRVVLADGQTSLVRTFPAELVARVDRTGRRDTPPPPLTPDKPPPGGSDLGRCGQMLREGWELLNDGEPAAALRAVQRAVQEAPAEVLPELERQCRAERGLPLDELLATLRVYVAARADRGRGFELRSATTYERAALGRVLAAQIDELLGRTYQGRSVAQWAAHPAEYTELQPDARRFATDAARAAALLTARMRYDPALEHNRPQMTRLTHLRGQLVDLAAQIRGRPGFLNLSPDDAWEDPAVLPGRCGAATSQPAVADGADDQADNAEAKP